MSQGGRSEWWVGMGGEAGRLTSKPQEPWLLNPDFCRENTTTAYWVDNLHSQLPSRPSSSWQSSDSLPGPGAHTHSSPDPPFRGDLNNESVPLCPGAFKPPITKNEDALSDSLVPPATTETQFRGAGQGGAPILLLDKLLVSPILAQRRDVLGANSR